MNVSKKILNFGKHVAVGGLILGFTNVLHAGPNIAVGGLVQADDTYISANEVNRTSPSGGKYIASGANLRQLILSFKADLGNQFNATWVTNFAGQNDNSKNCIETLKAYLSYSFSQGQLWFGQFYTPMGLEWTEEVGDLMFMERSLASIGFMPRNHFGFSARGHTDMFTGAFSVVQPPKGIDKELVNKRDKVGVVLRLTFSPEHVDGKAYHFGLTSYYQPKHDADENGAPVSTTGFSTSPEIFTRFQNKLISTGPKRSNHYNVNVAELGAVYDQLTLQGEYFRTKLNRPAIDEDDTAFKGWYVQGGYMLTGESRTYNFVNGTYGNPVPNNKEYGAWELGVRYSSINLNRGDLKSGIRGGKEDNFTVGFNWFATQKLRFAVNYIKASIKPQNDATKRKLNMIGARIQMSL